MKTPRLSFLAALLLSFATPALPASTINPAHRHAYSANTGWIDCLPDSAHGAIIGRYVCWDYLYGANIGWVHLGNGQPGNGRAYSNTSRTDYGINHDGQGNLRGYAWGANVGWLAFEDNGAPSVDLRTGVLSGYAYGANIGWIGLSNLYAYVQTDVIHDGPDADADGIPDAWEYAHTNDLAALRAGADSDGDGVTDDEEYAADTDPLDGGDFFRITTATAQGGTNLVCRWRSSQSRLYRAERAASLTNAPAWPDFGPDVISPDPGDSTERVIRYLMAPQRFFRVKAVVPLERQ